MYRSQMQTRLRNAFKKIMKISFSSCVGIPKAFEENFLDELEKSGFTICTKEEREVLDGIEAVKKQNEKI